MSEPHHPALTPAQGLTLPSGTDELTMFRSLFFAYPDAMLLVDSAGIIVLANPSAERQARSCQRLSVS